MSILDNTIQLTAAQIKAVKPLIQATFPQYKGRRVWVSAETRMASLDTSWCEGFRTLYAAIDLNTMAVIAVPRNGAEDHAYGFGQKEITNVPIPRNVAVIAASWAGSKGLNSIHIYVNPADMGRLGATAAIGSDDIVDAVVMA